METKWQSKKNYVNHQFLQSNESAEWTKTVKFKYKTLSFPTDIENKTKFTGISFFCDNLHINADMSQDEFILGLNNHTYLEFVRKPNTNQFQLKGVRPLDSLDQSQVIWLQGWLPFQQEDS